MQSEVHDPNHFLYFDGLPDSEKTGVSTLRNGEVITQPMTAMSTKRWYKFPGDLCITGWRLRYQKGKSGNRAGSAPGSTGQIHTHYGRVRKIGRPSLWSYLGR
jgi:hypothetical protein